MAGGEDGGGDGPPRAQDTGSGPDTGDGAGDGLDGDGESHPFREALALVGTEVERHPALTLGVAVALLLVAFTGASQITSVTGNDAFTRDDPTFATYQDEFDRSVIAVLIRGDVADPETMAAIDRFDHRMTRTDDVVAVASPADRVRARYGRIPTDRASIAAAVDDDDSAILNVVSRPGLSQEEQRPLYERATEVRDWAAFPAGVTVTVTGQPAFASQMFALVQQTTGQLLGLAVLLMIVVLYLFFRGVRLRLLPIVAVFVGVLYTFGAMGYLGIPNSTLTSAVFPILIGLGIDYGVQFHTRYEEELETKPPREALPDALHGIGLPVFVAMAAAGLGFTATWVTSLEVPALVWFAQTSILGIVFSYLTGIIVLLAAITVYVHRRGDGRDDTASAEDEDDDRVADAAVDEDAPAASETEGRNGAEDGTENGSQDGDATGLDGEVGMYGRAVGGMSRRLAGRPVLVLALAAVLAVAGVYGSQQVDAITDVEDFVPADLPALLDLQDFRSLTGGGQAARFPMLVQGSRLTEPATLRWMQRFERIAERKPAVTDVDSPASAVAARNGGRIPATRAGVEAILREMPEELAARYYSGGTAQITVFAEQGMDTDETIAFVETVRRSVDFSRPPPGVDAELTGTNVISSGNITDAIENRNVTTLLGVLLVFLLLLLYYRDPYRSVAPIVPMLFVVGWQGLYMYLLGIEISPLSASLGALTVGIGAEYTIIVSERFHEERRKGSATMDAIETATARVGKAITVSGVTTVFGFSALILSPFPLMSDFGQVTVGIIAMTLVAALLTLPPVLVLLDRLEARLPDISTVWLQ
jgi:hypothetical protein